MHIILFLCVLLVCHPENNCTRNVDLLFLFEVLFERVKILNLHFLNMNFSSWSYELLVSKEQWCLPFKYYLWFFWSFFYDTAFICNLCLGFVAKYLIVDWSFCEWVFYYDLRMFLAKYAKFSEYNVDHLPTVFKQCLQLSLFMAFYLICQIKWTAH